VLGRSNDFNRCNIQSDSWHSYESNHTTSAEIAPALFDLQLILNPFFGDEWTARS
jgi:hypothetical protein